MWQIQEASSFPPSLLLLSFLFLSPLQSPFSLPVPVPASTTALVSVPASVSVPVLRSFSRLHPRPRPRPPPLLLSPFPSYLRSLVSTSVPVAAPAPSPSLLQAPFPSSVRFVPAPVHFFPSLGPGNTPSVQYVSTVIGPCRQSCLLPTSATPCLQRC